MPLPTDDLIIWASSDVNLPNLAGPNKVKPIDDLILKGWDFKQKPAADEFNYVLNNLGMHISYLEESKTYTFSGDVTGTATSTGSDDVTFNVSVTDNSHNHISANISDATSTNTPNRVVRRDVNGDMAANYIRAEAYFDGDLQGNADTASALQTARTINNVSFNGSANIVVEPYVEQDLSTAATRYLTFVDSSTAGHQRLNLDTDLAYNPSTNTLTCALSGNASSATKLATARTINGVSFDGSSNITTNSWGTSRTLTLAGAVTGSVSINGSGDVTLDTSVSSTSGVSILTGTVADGGTIPLPSGYSESQCKWLVSIREDNPTNILWDINEEGAHDHYKFKCFTSGRVVTAQAWLGSNNSQPGWIGSTANYIIIGVK